MVWEYLSNDHGFFDGSPHLPDDDDDDSPKRTLLRHKLGPR